MWFQILTYRNLMKKRSHLMKRWIGSKPWTKKWVLWWKTIHLRWLNCHKINPESVEDGFILWKKMNTEIFLNSKPDLLQKATANHMETFSPTARMTSVRSESVNHYWSIHVHQMDVKTAFLNSPLSVSCTLTKLKVMMLPLLIIKHWNGNSTDLSTI